MANLFAKVSDGLLIKYPYSEDELRADHPQTSFPTPVSPTLALEFGVVTVVETPPPATTPFEVAVEGQPIFSNGEWRQQWTVTAAPPPASITPRQCRLILAQQGMLATVETIIAGMDEGTKITWEYALEFRRDDPLLNGLAAHPDLNLTPAQIDQFFIEAAQL